MYWSANGADATIVVVGPAGQQTITGPRTARFGYRTSANDRDGVWAEWAYDGARLTLTNDRYGLYPLFYFRHGDRFAVSTSIRELLRSGCPSDLDDTALAVFLRIGYFLGEDTPFRCIRVVPPGATLSWDGNRLRVESDRNASRCPAPFSGSRDDAISEYGTLFQAAIDRLCDAVGDERIALPLSGGTDSRHILFAMLKAGRPPDSCVTVIPPPPKADDDSEVAATVAARAGIRHVMLTAPADLFAAERRKNEITSFCADEHAWLLPLRDHLVAGNYAFTFDGLAGDVLSQSRNLTPERVHLYESGLLANLAEELVPHDSTDEMLRPEYRERWSRSVAVDRLTTELEPYMGAPNAVGQFFFWNRARREVALSPWRLLNPRAIVVAPFLDRALYDFLTALPVRLLLDRRLHSDTVSAFHPEYADIPYEQKQPGRRRSGYLTISRAVGRASAYCFAPDGRARFYRRSYFTARLVRALVDADRSTRLHVIFNKAVYLSQLEALQRCAESPGDAPH